jgi:hypothetical protein
MEGPYASLRRRVPLGRAVVRRFSGGGGLIGILIPVQLGMFRRERRPARVTAIFSMLARLGTHVDSPDR